MPLQGEYEPSPQLRKATLMRVDYEGRDAAITSLSGSPKKPAWRANVVAHPLVELHRRMAGTASTSAGVRRCRPP